ncbi:MAG: toll/interleukin-1 receptor domain-containing protein [Anaerolineae bacterium]
MEPQYDAFVSYSSLERDWVENWLLPRLESAGIQVCIDFRDFDIGVPTLDNIDEAVARSVKTLVVLTPNWVKSEWTAFESLLAQTSDPAGIRRRILPLMLVQCEPPRRLGILTWADFRDSKRWDAEIKRVISAIKQTPTADGRTTTNDGRRTSDDGPRPLATPSSPPASLNSIKTDNQSGGVNITGGQFSGNTITGRDQYEIHGNVNIYQGGVERPTASKNQEETASRPAETHLYSRRGPAGTPLRVLISHAAGDAPAASDLYRRLRAGGFDPWLDTESILPGQQAEREISRAVRASDVVLVCLSQNAVNKAGRVHKEIKYALDVADEQPEDAIFLIPVKLEPCDLPERLDHLAPVNLYEPNGYERLLLALRRQAIE